MIRLTRAVVRETAEVYQGRAMVVRLEEGGRILRIKLKGLRSWYTIPYRSIFMLGARIRAEEIKREKAEKRAARKEKRGVLN